MPGAPVTPSNFTTARQNLSDGIIAVLNAIKAANPTLLRQTWSSRPGSFPETPCAFIGNINEQLIFDSGLRRRLFTVDVVLVDKLIDNIDTGNRIDALVDLCVEWFTANVQIVTNASAVMTAPLVQIAGTDGELDIAGPDLIVHYASHTLTFGGPSLSFQEGRN